ncbi:hypothetical protein IQ07DRAFT_629469 [Pyrenochaeta sp. DS3sAY3a]|nr:hypothetical protein IQ07DRAFT_629469 [Pyrenochaeta sp. DS3sAY3a]
MQMATGHGKRPSDNAPQSRISIQEIDDNEEQLNNRGVFIPALRHAKTYGSEKTVVNSVSKDQRSHSNEDLPNSYPPQKRRLLRTWRWELFTWLLGTLGLTANIILLICFDGKRLSQWKSTVQITTFVAALAQLSQSALLVPVSFCIGQLKWTWFTSDQSVVDVDRFDLASRGPDGSMKLLYRMGLRPRLVSLGAIATIMLLAFPSFIQQAVNTQLSEYALSDTGAAHVYRLKDFTNTSNLQDGWDVFAAIDNGLISSNVYASNASVQCVTDHCTWEPYTTLGMSVKTEDVTNLLVTEPDMPALFPFANHSWDRTRGYLIPLNETTFQVDTKWIFSEEYPTPAAESEEKLADLAQIYLSYYDPCLNTKSDPNWRDLKYWRGFRASFRLALFTLKSTYEQHMTTEVVQTYDDPSWIISPLISATGLVERQLYCTEHDGEQFCLRNDKIHTIGEQLDYAMDPSMMWASYMPVILNQTKSGGVTETSYFLNYAERGQYLLPDVLGTKSMFTCENETGIGLEGFTRKMDNMAISLSNAFRTKLDYNGTRVNGTAWKTEPHIKVSYVWLIMPLALYTVITIFLFVTMYHTRNAPPWKSSILALLRCMDPDNKLGTPQQLNAYGKHTTVRLEEIQKGETWQLLDTTAALEQPSDGRKK